MFAANLRRLRHAKGLSQDDLAKPTLTAMWAELFGTESLGAIRSAVAMYMVFATALAPFVFGAALAVGMSVSGVLAAFVAAGFALTLPPVAAERMAWR